MSRKRTKRLKRYSYNYDPDMTAIAIKLNLPRMKQILRKKLYELIEVDEPQLYDRLKILNVPEDQYPYYAGFFKRAVSAGESFDNSTFLLEGELLVKEFVERGLDEGVLRNLLGLAAIKIREHRNEQFVAYDFPRLKLWVPNRNIWVSCKANNRCKYEVEPSENNEYRLSYFFEDSEDYDLNDAKAEVYEGSTMFLLRLYYGDTLEDHVWFYDDTMICEAWTFPWFPFVYVYDPKTGWVYMVPLEYPYTLVAECLIDKYTKDLIDYWVVQVWF